MTTEVEPLAPCVTDVIDETIERIRALGTEEIVAALDDGMFWDQEGPGFSCTEAEALGALLYRAGVDIERCAELVVRGHGQCGRSEDEGDLHWHREDSE